MANSPYSCSCTIVPDYNVPACERTRAKTTTTYIRNRPKKSKNDMYTLSPTHPVVVLSIIRMVYTYIVYCEYIHIHNTIYSLFCVCCSDLRI